MRLYLRLSNGTSSLALVALQPEIGQQYFNLKLLLDSCCGSFGYKWLAGPHPSTII